MDESNKQYRKSYHFFLTELFKGINGERGLIVELMRAAGNIYDLRKFLVNLGPQEGLTEDEKLIYVENDSAALFAFNLMGAQLRETLKLFDKFTKTEIYKEFKLTLSVKSKQQVINLENAVIDYKTQGNIMHDLLIPLRNLIFHYDDQEAETWVNEVMNEEKNKKPIVRSLSPDEMDFSVGRDFNEHIYSKLIFLPSVFNNGSNLLIEIGNLQMNYLTFVKQLSKFLLRRANIKRRNSDWIMSYMYGYREH